MKDSNTRTDEIFELFLPSCQSLDMIFGNQGFPLRDDNIRPVENIPSYYVTQNSVAKQSSFRNNIHFIPAQTSSIAAYVDTLLIVVNVNRNET